MMALKAARAFTGRAKIAKCEGAYHGCYDSAEVSLDPPPEDGAGDAPASVAYAKGTPTGGARRCRVIPFNDPDGGSLTRARRRPRHRADRPDADRAGWCRRIGLLEAFREITREDGSLLVFDEVISFRLGSGGAQGLWGVGPT